jgi:membrane protease YdiL (CAAX protease family)
VDGDVENIMRGQVQRYSVVLFVCLTLLLTFLAYPLPIPAEGKAIGFPVIVVFIPTLVATALAAIGGGRAQLRELYSRLRPGKVRWLLIGVAVGVALQAAIAVTALVGGAASSIHLTTSPAITIVALFTPIFALGEEIGWRGYALPKLLPTHSRLAASLLTGLPWAMVHLSLFLPGMMFVGRPLLAQVAPIALFAILHTWVFVKSGESVLAPALLHGTFNAFGAMINSDLPPLQATYIGAAVLVASAVIVMAVQPAFWFNRARTDQQGESAVCGGMLY